jgi:hypothetical protein
VKPASNTQPPMVDLSGSWTIRDSYIGGALRVRGDQPLYVKNSVVGSVQMDGSHANFKRTFFSLPSGPAFQCVVDDLVVCIGTGARAVEAISMSNDGRSRRMKVAEANRLSGRRAGRKGANG